MTSIIQSQLLGDISQIIDRLALDTVSLFDHQQPASSNAPTFWAPQISSPPSSPTSSSIKLPKRQTITTMSKLSKDPSVTFKNPTTRPSSFDASMVNSHSSATEHATKISKVSLNATPSGPPKFLTEKINSVIQSENGVYPTLIRLPSEQTKTSSSFKVVLTRTSITENDVTKRGTVTATINSVPKNAKVNDDQTGKPGVIAGAVIGSVLGLTAIAAFFIWINRFRGRMGIDRSNPEFDRRDLDNVSPSRPCTQIRTPNSNTVFPMTSQPSHHGSLYKDADVIPYQPQLLEMPSPTDYEYSNDRYENSN
ncbi:hypothetical protein G6F46_008509 [Rhizopus delemar]|uniref:Uncharacterized protein n=2 Tax=Rhizopus TaxID=4842 RepID=A0A9P7CMA0_9FUNG|nr:hypothetical protein G6F55_008591 [Rhizopus delemar]KAG1539913.1 hypothetical protein G6F51_008841 [Rhizopus arrhizus]KAG1494219.1 hypothetical protein G6F54_008035 [Rhizopus delemar]KAG1508323.1 hypothetical protein G6F53_008278 [Rhizopus delemar]KAG1521831.1 hypothetical protein G6F52_006391 [Rhizopus delemar]